MNGEWLDGLDGRLRLAAQMVPPGARAADVGCDHARLPIALVRSGRCPLVIASDLRQGPLRSARDNVIRAGLEGKIQLRQCDGLDGIAPGEVDCVVMAGMGGILMTQIIERAFWLKDPAVCLVLQPMSDAHLVRRALWEGGFALEQERAATANRRVYTVMRFRYTGRITEATQAECYAGLLPLGGRQERLRLEREVRALNVQIDGVSRAGREPRRLQELTGIRDELCQMLACMPCASESKEEISKNGDGHESTDGR